MITFHVSRTQPQTSSSTSEKNVLKTKALKSERPIADIEDFQSIDRVCLSCPSKGDQALPLKESKVTRPMIQRKPK